MRFARTGFSSSIRTQGAWSSTLANQRVAWLLSRIRAPAKSPLSSWMEDCSTWYSAPLRRLSRWNEAVCCRNSLGSRTPLIVSSSDSSSSVLPPGSSPGASTSKTQRTLASPGFTSWMRVG